MNYFKKSLLASLSFAALSFCTQEHPSISVYAYISKRDADKVRTELEKALKSLGSYSKKITNLGIKPPLTDVFNRILINDLQASKTKQKSDKQSKKPNRIPKASLTFKATRPLLNAYYDNGMPIFETNPPCTDMYIKISISPAEPHIWHITFYQTKEDKHFATAAPVVCYKELGHYKYHDETKDVFYVKRKRDCWNECPNDGMYY